MTAGGVNLAFSVTITGNSLNGTYNVIAGGACTGDSGTVTATRPSGAAAATPIEEFSSAAPTRASSSASIAVPANEEQSQAGEFPWWVIHSRRLVPLAQAEAVRRPGARLVGVLVDRLHSNVQIDWLPEQDGRFEAVVVDASQVLTTFPQINADLGRLLAANHNASALNSDATVAVAKPAVLPVLIVGATIELAEIAVTGR